MAEGFIPVSKKEAREKEERITVAIDLVGEPAVKFKKMAIEAGLSLKELGNQMATHCLK